MRNERICQATVPFEEAKSLPAEQRERLVWGGILVTTGIELRTFYGTDWVTVVNTIP
ncbi:MAG: hypothetical protein H8E44_32365 [Planctomycetes bacterium]|nr:hypothetical protein [Planctomycetota bacterium]MBL7041844.1 hypothetical protein [Pirellulaceae bacterium]